MKPRSGPMASPQPVSNTHQPTTLPPVPTVPVPPLPESRPLKIRLHVPSGHSLSVPVPVHASDLSSLLLTASAALLASPLVPVDPSFSGNPRVLASRSLWLLPDGSPLSSSAWRAYTQAAQSAPWGRVLPDLPVFAFPPSSSTAGGSSHSHSHSQSFSSRNGSISMSSSTSESASASGTGTPPTYLQSLFAAPSPAQAALASIASNTQLRDHSPSPHRLPPHTAAPSPTPTAAAVLSTSPKPASAPQMAMSATLVDPHAQLVPVDPSLSTHSSMTASSSSSSYSSNTHSTYLSSSPQPASVPPLPPPPPGGRPPLASLTSSTSTSTSTSADPHADPALDPALATRLRVQSRAHAVLAARDADLRAQLDRADKPGVGQELEWVERVRGWVDEWQSVVDELKRVQIAGRDGVTVMSEVAARAAGHIKDGDAVVTWDVLKIADGLRDCLERMSNYLSQRTALLTSALPSTTTATASDDSYSPPSLPYPHTTLLLLSDTSAPATPDIALATNASTLSQFASSISHLSHAVPSALRLSALIARIGEQEAAPLVQGSCKVLMDRHVKFLRRWERARSEVGKRHEIGEQLVRVVRAWARGDGNCGNDEQEEEEEEQVIGTLVALCRDGAVAGGDHDEDVELSPSSSRTSRPRSPSSPSPVSSHSPDNEFADALLVQIAAAMDSYLSPHARTVLSQLSNPPAPHLAASSASAVEPLIQPSTAPPPAAMSPTAYSSSSALISPTATIASFASTVIGPALAAHAPLPGASSVNNNNTNACISSSASASSIATITSPARAGMAGPSPPSPIPEAPAPSTTVPAFEHAGSHGQENQATAAWMVRVTQLVAAYDALVGDLLAARAAAAVADASGGASERVAFDSAAAAYFDSMTAGTNGESTGQADRRRTWRELAATFPVVHAASDESLGVARVQGDEVEMVVANAERRYLERVRRVTGSRVGGGGDGAVNEDRSTNS